MKKKVISIFGVIFGVVCITVAQDHFDCEMDNTTAHYKASSCELWNNYFNEDVADTQVKTIRLTFHVFTINDTGNIPENAAGIAYLNDMFNRLCNKFENLDESRIPSSYPYIEESRISFSLENIYFWDDAYAWQYQGYLTPYGTNLYQDFVISNTPVEHKTTSVHVFFSGSDDGSGGYASGIGDKRFIVLGGRWQLYQLDPNYASPNALAHELGHSMGLSHTIEPTNPSSIDDIDDTPSTHNLCWNLDDPAGPDCDEWSEVSNNIMDYNASRTYLSLGQIHKAHHYLLGHRGNISDCVVESIVPQVFDPIGGDIICNEGVTYIFQDRQLGVEIDAATTSNIITDGCDETLIHSSNVSANGSGTITYTYDYGDHGTIHSTKNVTVIYFEDDILNICDIPSSNTISAKTIQLPYPSCPSPEAVVKTGSSLSVFCQSIILHSGFEVEIGGTLEIQAYACD